MLGELHERSDSRLARRHISEPPKAEATKIEIAILLDFNPESYQIWNTGARRGARINYWGVS